eukprot:2959976-Pleurochrysis_carterae.AAC.1
MSSAHCQSVLSVFPSFTITIALVISLALAHLTPTALILSTPLTADPSVATSLPSHSFYRLQLLDPFRAWVRAARAARALVRGCEPACAVSPTFER